MFKKISLIGILALLVLLFAVAPASAHNGGIYPADNLTDAMKGDFNDYLIPQGTVKNLVVIHGHGFEYDFGDITTPLPPTEQNLFSEHNPLRKMLIKFCSAQRNL